MVSSISGVLLESPRPKKIPNSFLNLPFLCVFLNLGRLEAPSRYSATADQKMLNRTIVSQCVNVFMAIKIEYSTTTASYS